DARRARLGVRLQDLPAIGQIAAVRRRVLTSATPFAIEGPRSRVSVAFTLDRLKQAMVDAGLEIYRANGSEIRIAERVRVHLMDSAVAITIRDQPLINLTVRSQRSDFP